LVLVAVDPVKVLVGTALVVDVFVGAGRAVTEVDGAPGAFVRPLMVDAPFTRGFVEVRAASELTLTFASPFREDFVDAEIVRRLVAP